MWTSALYIYLKCTYHLCKIIYFGSHLCIIDWSLFRLYNVHIYICTFIVQSCGPHLRIINVRLYEGIYFHMFFIHFMVKWRLLLNCYFADGDDFRQHIYLGKKKQFYSRFIKTDESALVVYVLIICQFFPPFCFFIFLYIFLFFFVFFSPLGFLLLVFINTFYL